MLERILAAVRATLPTLSEREEDFRLRAQQARPARDLLGAITGPGLAVIAELKRRSPSAGVLGAAVDPVAQARSYVTGGAAALSVLTEPSFFGGSPADLGRVAAEVDVPVLRKDFVVEPVQVWQSRAMGADAVLLIVAAVGPHLELLLTEARSAGLAALVEVHDEAEVEAARAAGADLIGVNNRSLATMTVDLATAERLAPRLDGVAGRVAESGIATSTDAQRMAAAGYQAVLVGEALMRSGRPAEAVARLSVGR